MKKEEKEPCPYTVHESAGVCVCISVYLWLLDQARWWSGWLVLAELISQFLCWERQSPLLLLPRPSWLFSNETGGQGAVTLTGEPDTWKWDPDPHAGIEKEDGEGPGGKRSEEGEGWGGGGWPNSCQRTEWQVKEGGRAAKLLQGPLSDKRRKAHLCIRSNGCNRLC